MSEFDMMGLTSGTQQPAPRAPRGGSGGGWYFPLTLLSLLLVGSLSVMMCFLTDFMKDRPVWVMGLIFMIPAGCMFFAAMLLEFATNAMTPNMSRKPQVIVAVIATLLTFLIACLCDGVYLYSGIGRDAGVQFILAVDRGDRREEPLSSVLSLEQIQAIDPTYTEETSIVRALDDNAVAVLNNMPDYTDVGMIAFNWDTVDQMPIGKANSVFKAQMPVRLESAQDTEGVSYANLLDSVLDMVEQANNDLPTRVLIFTAGYEALYLMDDQGNVVDNIKDVPDEHNMTLASEEARQALVDRCLAANVKLYAVSPNGDVAEGLRDAIFATDGLCVSVAEAISVPDFVSIMEVDSDMLRASSLFAKILTGIMLLLEGLTIGICISIMLSRQGQKRIQVFISPAMAILSFVLLKLLGSPSSNPLGVWWLWEGLSFLPMGLIFMSRNGGSSRPAFNPAMAGGDPFAGAMQSGSVGDPFAVSGQSNAASDPFASGSNDNQSSGFDWNL